MTDDQAKRGLRVFLVKRVILSYMHQVLTTNELIVNESKKNTNLLIKYLLPLIKKFF